MTIKPWMWVALVVGAWVLWTRRGLTATAPAGADSGATVQIWQTFRAVPAGSAETEGRSSATEAEMRATKAAVEANGGSFRYYQLTT